MKTIKMGKKIFLKKEKIASLTKQQLNSIKGGGTITWAGCPIKPTEPSRPSDVCGVR